MPIYLKNNHAKSHPDLISNDGILGFLKRSPEQEEQDAPLKLRHLGVLKPFEGPKSLLACNLQ